MRTIEQAIKDDFQTWKDADSIGVLTGESGHSIGFKGGVKFMQIWIDVTKKMPKQENEAYLVKAKNSTIAIFHKRAT